MSRGGWVGAVVVLVTAVVAAALVPILPAATPARADAGAASAGTPPVSSPRSATPPPPEGIADPIRSIGNSGAGSATSPSSIQLPRGLHETILRGGGRRPSDAPSAATVSLSYSSAASLALSATNGFDGISGWSVLEALGIDSSDSVAFSTDTNLSANFGCVLTVQPGFGSTYVLDGTPSNASAGAAAGYVLFLAAERGNDGVLVFVNDGAAVIWYSVVGFECASYILGYDTFLPTSGLVDSPEAIDQADLAGGASYLRSVPAATEEWELFPGYYYGGGIGDQLVAQPPDWLVLYYGGGGCATPGSPSGAIFEAEIDALSGAVLANATARCSATYDLNFAESGLPAGTAWSVEVGNATVTSGLASSTGTTLAFPEDNGTLDYSVPNQPGFVPNLSTGSATIDGANVTVSISFSATVTYDVNFTEVGLPGGAMWAARIGGPTIYGSTPTLTIVEPSGSYSYAVAYVPEFEVSPPNGSLSLISSTSLQINYTAIAPYPVDFVESGLPSGSVWGVQLSGSFDDSDYGSDYPLGNESTGTAIDFAAPNGTYFAYIAGPPGYEASTQADLIEVNGTGNTTTVAFQPASEYAVEFQETGLASGTAWFAEVNGILVNSSGASSLDFELPNSTYTFTAGGVPGHTADPASGSFGVDGAEVTEMISFGGSVQPESYAVTFDETGLPAGSSWSVDFAGTTSPSTGTSIAFDATNGSYPYTVVPPIGFVAVPASGTVPVQGAPVTTAILFTAIGTETFGVSFVETGLARGTSWSVTLAGLTDSSSTGTVEFNETNGSFAYRVGSVAGYTASPASGSVQVMGSAESVGVEFTPTNSSSGGGGSSGGFLGLPGDTGYVVVGGAAIAVIVGILIGVHSYAPAGAGGIAGGAAARRARRRATRGPPAGPGNSWQSAMGAAAPPSVGGAPPSAAGASMSNPPPVGGPGPAVTPGTNVPSPVGSVPPVGVAAGVAAAAFCPECGRAFKGSQKFCTNCGRSR
jgi:hypothetical protein